MSSERLTSLTIQNLRGSIDTFTLSFEKGKPLTVIYGENGTGKSTICDALEFLGHGKVGSIENRGLGRLPGYWASLGKTSKDISVELKTDNSVCCAQVNKSKVFVHPPENKPKVEILRRSQILELIESSPGDRYKAIARFIDVSGIEESENNLIRLIKSLKDDRKTAIALTQQSRETIEGFYTASKVKGKEPLEWAKEELLRDASSLGKEAVALENLKDSYSALNQRATSIKQAYKAVENAKTDFASAQQQLEQIAKSATVDSSELLGLWKTARRFLHSHSPLEKCPLCESAENAEGLAESIDQRISQLAALNAASEVKERSEKALARETAIPDS